MPDSFRLTAIVAALLLFACAPKGPYVWASKLPPSSADASVVRAGDRLQVVVHGQEAMSGEFEVRPGGQFIVPVAGQIRAAGLTTGALAAELTKRLQGVLTKPYVTVIITARQPATVSVLGEVRTPGRYDLREGDGLLEALAKAGGLTPFADEDSLFVVRRSQPATTPRVRFRFADLASGVTSSIDYRLLDGDVIVVE
jgi:polysaccharide export outer membrane protein